MEFCPGCGKKSTGICRDCRPAKELKVKDMTIRVCFICNRYFYRSIWNNGKLEPGVKKIITSSIKEKVDDIRFTLPVLKNGIKEVMEIEVFSDDDIFKIPAMIEATYCDNCKKQGKYYEGVLQLRNASDEIIHYVKKYIFSNHIHISDEVMHDNGMDLQLSDKKKLHTLGNELHKKFGGKLKVNEQIFTRDRQTSKDMYRIHLYYEAPNYKPGDVVKIDNKLVLLRKVSKTVTGFDLITQRDTSVNMKGDYTVLIPVKTRVSKVFPSIEVLDPETFQSVPTVNKKDLSVDEKVTIVNDNGSYYLL